MMHEVPLETSLREKRLITILYFTVLGQIISIYRHTKNRIREYTGSYIQVFVGQWLYNEITCRTPSIADSALRSSFYVLNLLKRGDTSKTFKLCFIFVPFYNNNFLKIICHKTHDVADVARCKTSPPVYISVSFLDMDIEETSGGTPLGSKEIWV